MKTFNTSNIRNIVLLGHAGCGKTTLAECMLFEGGLISRRGSVTDGNSVSDYHELEKERGNSLFSTLNNTQWKGDKINIIDTPGFNDFVGEVISSLKVADNGVMILNAQNGVEVGSEIIWEYTEAFKTPMIFVVNQLDSDKADFNKTVEQARNRFGNKVTVVQYPLNQGDGFDTIIDVLKMTMYKFPAEGGKPEKSAIPDAERERAEKLHNELVESIAENDEGLMETYFEKGTLTEEEMTIGLRISMIRHDIFPLFCCSAINNMGSGRVMGFLHDVAPSAKDVPPITRESGKVLECDPEGPTVVFIYKTLSEPHLGDMSFFKVYSGELKVGDELVNSDTGQNERFSQLFVMNGKIREQVESFKAGDIGATVKLKSTHTNNTLHPKGKPFNISKIDFPAPRYRVAVSTDNKADVEKLAMALHQVREEDPSLLVEQSQELKQTIVQGQGELHIAMIKWKIEKNFKINVILDTPKIPYRETIQKPAKAVYRHKKQSGGSGQFGEVHMLVEPYYENMPPPPDLNVRNTDIVDLDWGGKLVYNNCIVGGAIDNKFIPAILKGIMEKMVIGPITGSYVRDIRVSVYDGKMHPVDSNEMAFKLAGLNAFKEAFSNASPQILEPISKVTVLVTPESMGDVMSDLQNRRGIIEGMDADGHYQKIIAKVPLSEMHSFSSTLRSITQGRANFNIEHDSYAIMPHDLQSKLTSERKGQLEEA